MSDGTAHKSVLERFLTLFTDVRAGEGPLTLLMAFKHLPSPDRLLPDPTGFLMMSC